MIRLKTRGHVADRSGFARALVLLLAMAAGPAARAAELTPQQKLEMKQLYERATRAYDVGKYNEAIEAFRKSIALDPSDAAVHASLGSALLQTGGATRRHGAGPGPGWWSIYPST